MTDKQLAYCLTALVESDHYGIVADHAALSDRAVRDVVTYEEAGVLTNNAGFVIRMVDGSEFQITVVRSRGPRS